MEATQYEVVADASEQKRPPLYAPPLQQQQQQQLLLQPATGSSQTAAFNAPQGQVVYAMSGDPPTMVALQGATYASPPPATTYLAWSIVNLVLCCLPLGIAATVYSVMAGEARATGNYHEVVKQAKVARVLNIVATTVGSVLWAGGIIFLIIFFVVWVPQMK